jgi:hypothetical protein
MERPVEPRRSADAPVGSRRSPGFLACRFDVKKALQDDRIVKNWFELSYMDPSRIATAFVMDSRKDCTLISGH